ncbi:hypothetical protein HUG15_20245 [Salicibibacter cibarius]|uniref:Uncharacterized protein n=1 Tax=Salicibibacter cibarius TaxID=2743000 RepID=A0A7T6Z646_9BACI|nr:hypothetical protein [Salicibibacter cibarius]QQK77685.1 hypothetical protein HUG15_20245 [Salicibibacter cibarius]
MQTWIKRDNNDWFLYEVNEVAMDGDLHEFMIRDANGNILAMIRPDNLKDQSQLIDHLNNGKSVDGWKDSKGNTIFIPIGEEGNHDA